jgi:adenosylcobinamide-phosphate synthase
MTPATHGLVVLAGALGLDLAVGEPPKLLHPVVWMGRLQRLLRRLAPRRPAGAFAWGGVMALAGPLLFGGGGWLLLRPLGRWPLIELGVEIYLFKSAFAVRALATAGLRVGRALAVGDLDGAREGLRSLCSRDPSRLPAPLVAAAAIESVAENASDSVVAPLFYWAVVGVPGALAYRAANTLDALIGYHGETEWLGKPAARLDDALNLLPARLTAALVVIASAIAARFTTTGRLLASPVNAMRIWRRDGRATESPNAGRPMAAMAGALGVELEKVGCYRLGSGGTAPGAGDVGRAVAVMGLACALAAVVAALAFRLVHA